MLITQKKLTCSDIGYHGKSIDRLSKEELIELCLELARSIHDCSTEEAPCKNVFAISKTITESNNKIIPKRSN